MQEEQKISIWDKTALSALAVVGVLIASVIIWDVYVRSSHRYTNYNDYRQYERNQSAKKIVDSCGSDPVCVSEKLKSRDEKNNSNDDLTAQQNMAFWTGLMGLFTAGMTLLTGLAVFFVYRTLNATRDTLEEAGRTTKAAQAATREAQNANTNAVLQSINQREFTQRELRAYIVANSAELNQDVEKMVSVWFTIANSGQTPAYNVEIRKSVVFWKSGFEDMTAPTDDEMALMDPIIIGPNDAVKTSISKKASLSEMKKLREGKLICLVFGLCTYWDIFDNTLRMEIGDDLPESEKKEWFTRFCFRLDGYGTENIRVVPYGPDNKAN